MDGMRQRSTGSGQAWRAATTALSVVVAALIAAAPAPAAVTIGEREVVVTTTGARAIAERAPFRLRFEDGDGRTVLQQVENTGQAPLPVAPAPDPIPGGGTPPKRPTLYAPFAFTVGGERSVQYPSSQYAGNQLAGVEAGTMYSARDVVDAKQEGEGATLTLSTSDPSGRTLTVSLQPGPGASIRVSVRPTDDAGVATMHDAFATADGEPFRGFGGRHNALDQRGQDFYNWNQQQNTSSGSLSPVTDPNPVLQGDRYQFPNGPHATYYNQALFYGDAFGFLVDRDELLRFRLASDRQDAWQLGVAAPALDYVVAPGRPRDAIQTITAISGRHRVPPDWALQPQMDRLVRFPPEGPAPYKASVEDDLRRFERGEIPLGGYRIEGWYQYSREELERIIARLKALGIRPLVYFRAFVESEPNGYDDPKVFREAVERGYVAKTPGGAPYTYLTNYNVPGALIDFTNPDARAWWEERIRYALDLGADGFMQDFGEQVQVDMRFHDGSTGATMHNRYPKLYHALTRDIFDRYQREHPGRELYFFTRTGYSGSPGSGAHENGNFAGDSTTDWSRSTGIGSIATDMLNRGVGGLYGFTTDIGGYFDVGPYQPTTKELFIRWAELAALTPLYRLHGSVGAGTHAPWTFDEETVRVYREISELHQRAVPLVKRLWAEAQRTGVPPTRPLWLAFPDDAEAAKQDQQWMLGDDVLVAPVVTQGATQREVYFPKGCWEHGETGARFTGPKTETVEAPLGRLPYFTRCGTRPFEDAANSPLGLPQSRTCRSRRNFVIRLRAPRGQRLRTARVFVNGKRVRVIRGKRLRARVDLRGLPRGRYRVTVTAVTTRGKRIRETRRYRTCWPWPGVGRPR
jgi:alpha-D-xyloside xylohydrolase